MQTYPHNARNATFIGDVIEYTYSLDDQEPILRICFGHS
jgi:hypothetical protein